MSNIFTIEMPCGRVNLVMGLGKLLPRIAHAVVMGEVVLTYPPTEETIFAVCKNNELPAMRDEALCIPHKLRETHNVRREMLHGSRDRMFDLMLKFMSDRFQEYSSKKPIEFYVPDLTLKSVEDLAYKFMENMGSENATLCIFKLSDFHKFVVLMDDEAFRFYRNEHGTHGELIELHPKKWVIGRYDNDVTILKEMEGMRRYNVG